MVSRTETGYDQDATLLQEDLVPVGRHVRDHYRFHTVCSGGTWGYTVNVPWSDLP